MEPYNSMHTRLETVLELLSAIREESTALPNRTRKIFIVGVISGAINGLVVLLDALDEYRKEQE